MLLWCGLALLSACETSFDPFDESEVSVSMFGYLDVAADTQFVRITPLQQSAFGTARIEATVEIEEVATGTRIPLRDSLVTFRNGATVSNFWAPTTPQPLSTYRLRASTPDGREAAATVETPDLVPAPQLNAGVSPKSTPQNPPLIQSITLTDVEKLADLRVVYFLSEPAGSLAISYLKRARRAANGNLILAINAYEDVQEALNGSVGTGCPGATGAEVFVATATEAWPDFPDIDIETLALPNAVSNVEGGLGYVGGVQTMRVPWPGIGTVFALHQAGCP